MRESKIINNILYVKCNKCGRFLSKDCFYNSNRGARWIYCNCKECRKKVTSESIKKYSKKHSKRCSLMQYKLSERYGFNRHTFHIKAYRLVLKKWLKPSICPICKKSKKIQIHHPFYESFKDWSKVILCCIQCHSDIHRNKIQCPEPIDLLLINKKW